MTLDGHTRIIAHIGYPTATFKASMIYNPYFESRGINACVVPMGVRAEDFAAAFPTIFRFSNVDGALITMPHKPTVVAMLDRASSTVRIAGACNAVKRDADGALIGDMFDGEGFVRGLVSKGQRIKDTRVLIVGAGGVGSAIAASLAAAGVAHIALHDRDEAVATGLADRLRHHYPSLALTTGTNDPRGFDIVVNATPLGMNDGDPLPLDTSRLDPGTFAGEVVLKAETTAFLAAAKARGCPTQAGVDMLFEQIPAYLDFFGFATTTSDALRAVARISY
jgi:shikimate dehydrogenase